MSFNREFFIKIFTEGYVSCEKREDYDPLNKYDENYTCDGCKHYNAPIHFPCVGCIRFNHSDQFQKSEEN